MWRCVTASRACRCCRLGRILQCVDIDKFFKQQRPRIKHAPVEQELQPEPQPEPEPESAPAADPI